MISAEADTAVESLPMEARYWFCEGCGDENPPILSSDALCYVTHARPKSNGTRSTGKLPKRGKRRTLGRGNRVEGPVGNRAKA
jgi:hypothetical protein